MLSIARDGKRPRCCPFGPRYILHGPSGVVNVACFVFRFSFLRLVLPLLALLLASLLACLFLPTWTIILALDLEPILYRQVVI